jgi:hypothetical protein
MSAKFGGVSRGLAADGWTAAVRTPAPLFCLVRPVPRTLENPLEHCKIDGVVVYIFI